MHRDIIIAITGKAVSLICLVVTIGLLARKINGIDFGLYMLFLGSVPFAAVLIQFGLHQVMMRRMADQLEQNFVLQPLLNTSIKKICLVSVFVGVTAYYFAIHSQTIQTVAGLNNINVALAVLWVLLSTLQLTLADAFKAFNAPAKTYVYGETGSSICLLLFLVCASPVLEKMDLEDILVLSTGSIAVFVVIGMYELQRAVKKHDSNAAQLAADEDQISYTSGLRIWAGYSLGMAFYPIALWYLGFYGGPVQAGDFALASKLAGLTVLPVLVTNSLMPRRISEYKVNQKNKNHIQNLNALAIGASLIVVMIIGFAGEEIVSRWLGGNYQNVLAWTGWLQVAKVIISICGSSSIILVIYHQDRRFIEAGLVGMVVLVGILYLPLDIGIVDRVISATVISAVVHIGYQFYYAFGSLGFFFPFPTGGSERYLLNQSASSGDALTAIRRPNLVIIGTPKAGTTTLYDALCKHKDIYLPRIKEPTFFNDNENYKWGFEYYLRAYYSEAKDQAIIADCTPLYIGSKKAAERIYEHLGENVKIIIVLRDPNERAFSHYVHNKKSTSDSSYARVIEKKTEGLEYADCIWYSMYYSLINIWKNKFKMENILILKFEDDIVNDLQGGLDKICKFLSIDTINAEGGMKSNVAKRSVKGLSGIRSWLYSNATIKMAVKKVFSPRKRQAIRILFDKLTTTEIKNKEKLNDETRMQIYSKYFHQEMVKLRDEYGVDYVIQ